METFLAICAYLYIVVVMIGAYVVLSLISLCLLIAPFYYMYTRTKETDNDQK